MIYSLLSRILTSGNYDAGDVQDKLDVYYAFGRITREQYEELSGKVKTRV